MKFFYDARYIRTDFHDGISRYSAELGAALATLTPVTFLIHDRAQLKLLPENAEHLLIHAPTSPKEPLTALILNQHNPDVVFSPMQTMGAIGRNFKLILTLHDMIYYRHRTPPRHLNVAIRAGWRVFHLSYVPQRLTLNSADIVATVSQTSKRDFEGVNLTKREIIVVPNAPQKLDRFLETPVNQSSPKNLIYMGSFMPYKNVETLIRGMKHLEGYTLHLLSRISPTRKQQLQQLITERSRVVFHGGVSDETYASLLANNAVLVSASLDEGYGLPLAEALELGVPAVVSDLAIFKEVAGMGARYFEPKSPNGFAAQVKKLEDTDTLHSVVNAGKAHIARYDWHTSAQTLLNAAARLHDR